MNGPLKDMPSTLDFFSEMILEPALELVTSYGPEESNVIADFGAVEAAQWALLGVQIGYLDADRTIDLLSSSELIFNAWTRRQRIYKERNLGLIVLPNEGGRPTLNIDLFKEYEWEARTRGLLHNTFQTILLLTMENLINREATYFIDSIGWTDTQEWIGRKRGTSFHLYGSVRQIVAGFADVLRYLEEIQSLHVPSLEGSPNLPDDDRGPLWSFMEDVRTIVLPRFNLNRSEIEDRYFVLAGELVGRTRDDGPDWLDARLSAFNKLTSMMYYVVGNSSHERQPDLWRLFATASASSGLEREEPLERS